MGRPFASRKKKNQEPIKVGKLYSSPLRVYLCLGFMALVGIYSGLTLSVSLFPNSSKPSVHVHISYGGSNQEEFLNTYGRKLESQLRNISTPSREIEEIKATYEPQNADYEVLFKWGVSPQEALKEVQTAASAFSSQLPQEIRDSLWVNSWNENSGFLAVSYYSSTRSLDDLHKFLEPMLTPLLSQVPDAAELELWNPSRKEISVELNPEKMAALQILPRDVRDAVAFALKGSGGGSVRVGLNKLDISLPQQVRSIETLGKALVRSPGGQAIHLADIAHIDMATPVTHSRSFKTSGAPSLILFATPKPGGNVKRMSEEIIAIVNQLQPTLPKDIENRILVDPSEFIRSAVKNVFHEVILAAFLAVAVLFLFIGNLKNVVTAAIEIPMSIVLAFILMKLTGININLISLGGLALSAGMNVDASVVVMENIFRHMENVKGPMDYRMRLRLISQAVSEVRFPIIASTIASLVVFLPLAFTSELTNALLGDLAMAVVFSHGFSAIVALILVPTVRLHIMNIGGEATSHSPIEKLLRGLENTYSSVLDWLLGAKVFKAILYSGLVLALAGLVVFVIPHLPREVIGRPDTDWVILGASTSGNTMVRQMESQGEVVEAELLKKFGRHIQYTFTQTSSPNSTNIMARLSDKKEMESVLKEMENHFTNTPILNYFVVPWNPSELPIPNPPQLELSIRGGSPSERAKISNALKDLLEESKTFQGVNMQPWLSRKETVLLEPNFEQWAILQKQGGRAYPSDLADMSRVATGGYRIGEIPADGNLIPIVMKYPHERVRSMEDLGSLPVGIGGKLVPLKALARLSIEEILPSVYRKNERELVTLTGKVKRGEELKSVPEVEKTKGVVDKWLAEKKDMGGVSVTFEDPQKELNESLKQLSYAVGLSVLLIFLTMVLQFGDVINALLVLIAVPLGFIGVLISLYAFGSTLSLNSVLGVILLNGIAVANSIILIDFLKRLVDRGLSPRAAALEAARKRLRPILMTSLTTGLGMLPIALGFGDGGRILQPLGIAVIGGLGFSMMMTLFIVPTLQVTYLQWAAKDESPAVSELRESTL
jgi:hydrophobic/amphiphilic exporter-1 (mainly G- bacteria), HAE1 family